MEWPYIKSTWKRIKPRTVSQVGYLLRLVLWVGHLRMGLLLLHFSSGNFLMMRPGQKLRYWCISELAENLLQLINPSWIRGSRIHKRHLQVNILCLNVHQHAFQPAIVNILNGLYCQMKALRVTARCTWVRTVNLKIQYLYHLLGLKTISIRRIMQSVDHQIAFWKLKAVLMTCFHQRG